MAAASYAEASLRQHAGELKDGEDHVDQTVARLDLAAALGLLSSADRDAVLLRYVTGLSLAEIARLQGKMAGTIRWRLHRAMRALQGALADSNDGKE